MGVSDEIRSLSLVGGAWCAELQPPSDTLVDESVVELGHLRLLCLRVLDDGVQLLVGQGVQVELEHTVSDDVCHESHLFSTLVDEFSHWLPSSQRSHASGQRLAYVVE